ncbi:MAG: PKD domain-containing protein, partial [Mameliella sp.]|nr:PKD domain-containing protein [Phaeodactylibacter sp.]
EATWTLVAVYDGHLDFLPTTFFQGQLAPDGKIYIASNNGVTSLHVIHNPDADCPNCHIEQHGIELPTFNAFSIPNQPNYRLGPIDGSPCDTLDIDNIPLVRWRYEQDTLTPFTVQFYDLSDYEPATWSWDFGEGSSSTDTLPAHAFPGPGTYEVCLTVSNANGSDTKCKTLEFMEPVSTAQQAQTSPLATAFPNPFRERFSLSLRAGWLPVQANAVVYDAMGRLVLTQRLSAGFNTLDLSGHPTGVYTWRVEERGRVLEVGKVVKIH